MKTVLSTNFLTINRAARRNKQNKQHGFGLVEILLSIGAIAGLTIGAIAAFNSWSAKSNTNRLVTHTALVQGVMKNVSAPFGTTDYTDIVIAGKDAKSDYWKEILTAGVYTAENKDFGGAATVVGAGTKWTMTEGNVDPEVCLRAAPLFSEQAFSTLQVGTGAIVTIPLTTAQARTACGNVPAALKLTSR